MLALSTVFVVARVVCTQLTRPKRWILQDFFVYLAFLLFLAMAILYILVTPILFRLTAVGEKRLKPYPTLKDEHKFMVRVFFVNSMMLWFILWTIKFSFLILYKNLMEGLRDIYFKLWCAVSVFSFLVCRASTPVSEHNLTLHIDPGGLRHLAQYVTFLNILARHTHADLATVTACSSMKAWFTPGACQTPRDVRSQIASLYYAYAVDVLTDLMSTSLPPSPLTYAHP